MIEQDEAPRQSVWHTSADMPTFDRLSADAEADVCVIGGGITGLTAALLLAREGRSVVLIERHRLGTGVTGSTTAHITSLIDADYGVISKTLGLDAVRGVLASTRSAIDRIDSLVHELGIECDFERLDAHYYAEPSGDTSAVRASFDALRAADVHAARLDGANGLPFATADTLVLPQQAAFHPIRYVAALARAAAERGVHLYEHTRAHSVHDGTPCVVETGEGHKIRAHRLLHATHTPAGIDLVQTEMTIYRSYVLAARVGKPVPQGLYFDTADPYRYVRRHRIGDSELALIGGGDHKTGKGDPVLAMRSLETYARERFGSIDVVARWSAQVYETSDGLPYIGWSPLAPHSVIATGFAGDGIVFGTLGAMIGADLISGRTNRWASLYAPARLPPISGAKSVVTKNLEVAKHLVVDRLKRGDAKALDDVQRGEGKIVRVDGRRLAVYRDASGAVHARSAVCPHMKCIVHWNAFERSWDCPCHGSRFDATGTAVEGPSMHDLHRVDIENGGPDRTS